MDSPNSSKVRATAPTTEADPPREPRREGCTCYTDEPDEHPCPYQEEINDNHEPYCRCCDVCAQECVWDI